MTREIAPLVLLRSGHRRIGNRYYGGDVIDVYDDSRLMSLYGGIVQQHNGSRTKLAHLAV